MFRFLIIYLFIFVYFTDLNAANVDLVASVNGEPITSFDLQTRVDLLKALAKAGGKSVPDDYKSLKKDILDVLIREKVQIAEGKKYNMTFAPSDVDKAMEFMEKNTKLPAGTIKKVINDVCGSNKLICHQQFVAQVIWSKFSVMYFAPVASVSDVEIDEEFKKYKTYVDFMFSNMNISQIVFDSKDKADEVYKKLKSDNVNNCKDFDSIAAKDGGVGSGNLGDLKLQDLSQTVGLHIKDLEVRVPSTPLKNIDSSYYIYMICDKKIDDKVADKLLDDDTLKNNINDSVSNQKIEAMAEKYLNKLIANAFIEYF